MARKKAARLGDEAPTPGAGPRAPSCAYILTLGKRHFKYAPSAYKVCITPTQAEHLFRTGNRPKPLGCGVFACAFQHPDPDKIVKITRDPSDVAGLIQGQGLPQVPTVYELHQLAGRPRWITPRRRTERYQQWPDTPEGAYALVVEKLQTFSGAEKSLWNKRIRRMRQFQLDAEQVARQAEQGTRTQPARAPRAISFTIGDMAQAVCPKRPAAEARDCQLRVRELNKMAGDLKRHGIEWVDIHAGNIGIGKNDRWKALDLGASSTPLETDVPILERAASARTSKRRFARGGKRA